MGTSSIYGFSFGCTLGSIYLKSPSYPLIWGAVLEKFVYGVGATSMLQKAFESARNRVLEGPSALIAGLQIKKLVRRTGLALATLRLKPCQDAPHREWMLPRSAPPVVADSARNRNMYPNHHN